MTAPASSQAIDHKLCLRAQVEGKDSHEALGRRFRSMCFLFHFIGGRDGRL